MSFNKGKTKVRSTAKKKTKNSAWNGDMPKGWGIITDPAGQLKFPGQPTRIPGNTMSTEGYGNIPLMVYPDVGSPEMINPNSGTHTFPGATYFDEYPMMQGGGGTHPTRMDSLNNYTKAKKNYEEVKMEDDTPYDELYKKYLMYKPTKSSLPQLVEEVGMIGLYDALVKDGDDFIPVGIPVHKKPQPIKRKGKDIEKIQPKGLSSGPDERTIHTEPREGIPKLPEPTIIGYTQRWDPESRKYIQEPQYQTIPEASATRYNDNPYHKQEGGEPTGEVKARLAYEWMHGNPAVKRMMSGVDNPFVFPEGHREEGNIGTHYMGSQDNYAVPAIQEQNGELVLNENFGPNSNEAIRFDNPNTANWFAENNYKKFAAGMDYEDKELSDEEIEEYRRGGYVVEELQKAPIETHIETEKTIIGYEQEWDGKKWIQAPVYENIPRRVINKKYEDAPEMVQELVGYEETWRKDGSYEKVPRYRTVPSKAVGGSIPMYQDGGGNGLQFPIYEDAYDFMERQSDTKKVLAPGEDKQFIDKPMFGIGINAVAQNSTKNRDVEYVCSKDEGCTAIANRAVESLMPNTSYFEHPLTTKKSLNAMYSAAGTKVKGQENTVYNPTTKEIEKYPYLEGDKTSGSLDAWDTIPQFLREHPENVIFSAVDDDPYKFRNKKKFAKDVWKEYDIPIGAYINVGDVSETDYTNRKDDVAGSHTVRVVGYKKDGEPLIADFGKIIPLSEVQYAHSNESTGGIAGIASVPGKEKYTYKYFKQREAEMNKPSTATYLRSDQLEGKSDEYKGYHNTISKQKNYLKTALGITDKDYDEYAKIALTLPDQESHFGELGVNGYTFKKAIGAVGGVESSGPAQLREKNVAEKYAQTLSKFEGDDEAYNAAAVITYIKDLDDNRKSSKGWASQGEAKNLERPWTRLERSPLDPIDTYKQQVSKGLRKFQGKEDMGYIYGDAGPDAFAYMDNNKKRQVIDLPYKTVFDSDEEYSEEVNALLKKKNPDLRFDFDKKGRRVIYAKTKGNIPEIKKSLKDFVFYSWQSPMAVRYGDAEGNSTYYQNNLKAYDKLFKKQLGGENRTLELTDEEVAAYRKQGYTIEEY